MNDPNIDHAAREATVAIQAAWAHAAVPPLPAGDRHDEATTVARFFSSRDWRSVDLGVLRAYRGDLSACLAFLPDQAFRYYLASFLIIALEGEGGRRATDVAYFTCLQVMPHEDWRGRIEPLDSAQSAAIAQFLRVMQLRGVVTGAAAEQAVAFWERRASSG